MRELLGLAVVIVGSTVVQVMRLVLWPLQSLRRWFRRHVSYRDAPLRTASGPFVLVLRSFGNRMATGRRIRRVWFDRQGREIDSSVVRNDPGLQSALAQLGSIGMRPDLGESKPDLTVFAFLGMARSALDQPFLAVSNGSSMGGVLDLVSTPDQMWFRSMTVLAAHARAIVMIPDNSSSLVAELKHVVATHPDKVVVLMPPSSPGEEDYRDIGKLYRFEGLDMRATWDEARQAAAEVGVDLPEYEDRGGMIRFHPDGSRCAAIRQWAPDELARIIRSMDESVSDSQRARRALRDIGPRLLLYDSPPGTIVDEAWYRRAFSESYHPRTLEQRRQLARQFPALGFDRPDHIMNVSLPQGPDAAGTSVRSDRCERCP